MKNIYLLIFFSFSFFACKNKKGAVIDLDDQKNWYYTEHLSQINEFNLSELSPDCDGVRLSILSPMGLPSVTYTIIRRGDKEIQYSYTRDCFYDSKESKIWTTKFNSVSESLFFKKEFFEKSNSEIKGDNMVWVIEQNYQGILNVHFIVGGQIDSPVPPIRDFLIKLPDFIPNVEELVTKKCFSKR